MQRGRFVLDMKKRSKFEGFWEYVLLYMCLMMLAVLATIAALLVAQATFNQVVNYTYLETEYNPNG